MSKILITYFTYSNGNTKRIAEMLHEAIGGDLEKIEMLHPYTGSYDDVVAQGQREVQRGYEPPIKPLSVNVEDYDVIAIGTPTWWYTMAPAVLTFLRSHKWAGKTVIPFMTNGGWPGHVIKDMKKACTGAKFMGEMEVQFDSTGGDILETPTSKLDKWLHEVESKLG